MQMPSEKHVSRISTNAKNNLLIFWQLGTIELYLHRFLSI